MKSILRWRMDGHRIAVAMVLALMVGAAPGFAGPDGAWDGPRSAVLFVDLGRIYRGIVDVLDRLDAPENAPIKAMLAQAAGPLGEKLGGSGAAADHGSATLEQFLARVRDFRQRAVIVPTGGLWVGFSDPPGLAVVLEANTKPHDLLAMIKDFGPNPAGNRVLSDTPERAELELAPPGSAAKPGRVEITPREVRVEIEAKIGQRPGPEWAAARAAVAGNLLALDLDGRRLAARFAADNAKGIERVCASNRRIIEGAVEMHDLDGPTPLETLDLDRLRQRSYLTGEVKCPLGGTYSLARQGDEIEICCSQHGSAVKPATPGKAAVPSHPLAAVGRAMAVVGDSGTYLKVSLDDPELRRQLKAQLENRLQEVRTRLGVGSGAAAANQPDSPLPAGTLAGQEQELAALAKGMSLIDEGPWLGVRLDRMPPAVSMIAAIGVGAAMALPSLQASRDEAKDKACRASRMIVLSGIEMYRMDHPDAADVTIAKLVDGGYLKSAPTCPSGGQLTIGWTRDGQPKVECSGHPSRE